MRLKITALAFVLALGGCAAEQAAGPPMPLELQPAASVLRPGLQARYIYGDFEHVDAMPPIGKASLGQPVANLAAGSNSGKLWEAQTATLYGVYFTGLIRLEPGDYQFAVKSNDGVRVTLDKTRLLEDPTAHPDRMSPPAKVSIKSGGWYSLTVQYFQRRGGAALELHWQPPGSAGLSIVPPEALAHLPG
jgi:hypothetical protein